MMDTRGGQDAIAALPCKSRDDLLAQLAGLIALGPYDDQERQFPIARARRYLAFVELKQNEIERFRRNG